jgi:hypothetical protein
MTVKKKTLLKVFFDSNAIYNDTAYYLLKKEIFDLINNHSNLPDIEIEWHIPEIVVKERKFQMIKRGMLLLPSLEKLEKLIGINVNITPQTIKDSIDSAIQKQIDSLAIKNLKLDCTKVNLETVIHNAVNRIVPFEDNDKEKGFRDSMILETFKQLLEVSPKTKATCRIIFISNDGKLNEAVQIIADQSNNIEVIPKIDDLEALINLLNSEIKDDLIKLIKDVADTMFFQVGDNANTQKTLLYKEKILQQIQDKFPNELSFKAEEVDERENEGWLIGSPKFIKKDKQKIFMTSRVSKKYKNYKYSPQNNPTVANTLVGGNILESWQRVQSSLTNPIKNDKILINEGFTRFEVNWSVVLTKTKKLVKPKIESINFISQDVIES